MSRFPPSLGLKYCLENFTLFRDPNTPISADDRFRQLAHVSLCRFCASQAPWRLTLNQKPCHDRVLLSLINCGVSFTQSLLRGHASHQKNPHRSHSMRADCNMPVLYRLQPLGPAVEWVWWGRRPQPGSCSPCSRACEYVYWDKEWRYVFCTNE